MSPSDSADEERALRAAVLAGDEAAWRILYERNFDHLYAYLHCRTGREVQRTEEAAQECWLVAVRRIRSFDPERGSFEAWLRGIAEKVLMSQRRKWRREETRPGVPEPGDSVEPAVLPGGTEESLDLADGIALVMTELPSRYQAVLRAKYDEGLSLAEIAARWGETPKAVESLLGRARAAFREGFSKFRERTIET